MIASYSKHALKTLLSLELHSWHKEGLGLDNYSGGQELPFLTPSSKRLK